MKGVFEISGLSRYDDEITDRYHFPAMYRGQARLIEGDWVLYRETGAAGGRKAYIAVARVVRIEPDPKDPTHSYARVTDFLELDRPVAYRDAHGRFAEQFLRELADPSTVGRALRGRSVRTIEGGDFAAIVTAGLGDVLDPRNFARLDLDPSDLGMVSSSALSEPYSERRVEQILVNRKFRDAAFRKEVLDAYDSTCAVTRLRIINGGGRAEAQAAHIWPVADGGPDIVQNGIALSATAHWLFDRHLISLDANFRLLVSHNKLPAEYRGLFPAAGNAIRLPSDKRLWPSQEYVARHRERFAGLSY